MSEAAAESSHGPFAALLALQDGDLAYDRLTHQIEHHPIAAMLRDIEARRTVLAKQAAELERVASSARDRQRQLEEEIGASDSRVQAIEARLRSAASGSFRDQGAMAGEIESLRHRKLELEDEELVVMEELEPLDNDLGRIATEEAALLSDRSVLGAELLAATGELERDREVLAAGRAARGAGVVPELLAEYERLRVRLGGIGAARVVRGACAGCNLSLSATELDHLRHAPEGTVSHCEQCGRILVL
jgi:predicted  nucleic acid-binding Zn-ribbon protein